MITVVEITINDRNWPELEIVLQAGTKIQKLSARADQAEQKFGSLVGQSVSQIVKVQIERRKEKYGS